MWVQYRILLVQFSGAYLSRILPKKQFNNITHENFDHKYLGCKETILDPCARSDDLFSLKLDKSDNETDTQDVLRTIGMKEATENYCLLYHKGSYGARVCQPKVISSNSQKER